MDNEEFTAFYFKLLTKSLVPYGYEPKHLINAIWSGTVAMVQNDGLLSNEKVIGRDFHPYLVIESSLKIFIKLISTKLKLAVALIQRLK